MKNLIYLTFLVFGVYSCKMNTEQKGVLTITIDESVEEIGINGDDKTDQVKDGKLTYKFQQNLYFNDLRLKIKGSKYSNWSTFYLNADKV